MKCMWRTGVLAVVLLGITGCAAIANSPLVVNKLKMVSAGHTGCLPDENEISNVNSGSSTWNATCKGKVYLCSGVDSYSCAPVAK
jgi:hypothetical protein